MKSLFFLAFILASISTYSQTKIYAFVGKKISVERVQSENTFYLKYKNVYKVEQRFDNEIKGDTLTFNSYTHMNQIRYSVYDYAIIYLIKNEKGEFVHRRTYFTPIILKHNNIWYGFESKDESIEDYKRFPDIKLNIRKNIKTGATVYPEKIRYKWLVKTFYPLDYFESISKNVVKIKLLKSPELLYQSR